MIPVIEAKATEEKIGKRGIFSSSQKNKSFFLTGISNDLNIHLIFSDSWNSDSSDSDSDLKGSPPPPSKRPGQRSVPLRKRKPTRRRFTSDEEESSEGSDEDTKR